MNAMSNGAIQLIAFCSDFNLLNELLSRIFDNKYLILNPQGVAGVFISRKSALAWIGLRSLSCSSTDQFHVSQFPTNIVGMISCFSRLMVGHVDNLLI